MRSQPLAPLHPLTPGLTLEQTARLVRVVNRVMSAAISEAGPSTAPWERWRLMVGGAVLGDVSADLDAAEAAGLEGAGAARIRRMALLEEVQALMTESTRAVAQEWAARPLAARVRHDSREGWVVQRAATSSGGIRWQAEQSADTHCISAHPRYAVALAEAEAECTRLNAPDKIAKAEKAVRRELLRGLWREWMRARPTFTPAASKGHDVFRRCADNMTTQVVFVASGIRGVKGVTTYQAGTTEWHRWETEDCEDPRPVALRAQKALAAACAAIAPPEGMDVVVERVQRVSITAVDDGYGRTETMYCTALVVQITSAISPGRAVIALLE